MSGNLILNWLQIQKDNQNVHLVTQMIWGKTTHVGCGWIQFPRQSRSQEDEYENILVCNYGVGGNMLGQSVWIVLFVQK